MSSTHRRATYGPALQIALALSMLAGSACAEPEAHRAPEAPEAPVVSGRDAGPEAVVYRGACDASAGFMLDAGTFVVGDDETNTLRTYPVGGGSPIGSLRLDEFLGVAGSRNPEADIEGATDAGELTYWITSHGRNRSGRWRQSRNKLFATRHDGESRLQPAGRPIEDLVDALIAAGGPVVAASVGRPRSDEGNRLEPKAGGLNVEALAATPDGRRLWIGLRNPLARDRALLFELANPAAALLAGEPLEIAAPLALDLGGLGLRAMEYAPRRSAYLIVAGSRRGGGRSRLYEWSGPGGEPRLLIAALEANPEAILLHPGSERIGLLSDDGTTPVAAGRSECAQSYLSGTCPCKYLLDARRKSFRGSWLSLP